MISFKRIRESTTYEIPEHIEKRLRIKQNADGSEEFCVSTNVAHELRDDIVKYICDKSTSVDEVFHTLYRFKHIFEPLELVPHIPVEFGVDPFLKLIRVVRLFFERDHFDYINTQELKSLLLLCKNEGFEMLLDDIIDLHYLFGLSAIEFIAHGISSSIDSMLVLGEPVSREQIDKIIDRIVVSTGLNILSIDKVNISTDSVFPRGADTLIQLFVQWSRFDIVLNYLDLSFEFFKSQDLTKEMYS